MYRRIGLLTIVFVVSALAIAVQEVPLSGQRGRGQAALAATDEAACQALLLMPNGTITYAAIRPASGGTPEYCYVRGTTGGSVRFHMQLPLRANWNKRLLNEGDGGKDGVLNFNDRRLAQGYAVANSNSGHDAGFEPNSSFGADNLQAVIDFGYRAVHLTALASKAVTSAYYGQNAQYTYFEGCSTGGRQGFMEAQRFPNDFDAIVVGAPVFNYQALNMSHVWMLQKLFKDHYAGNLAFDQDGDGVPESLTKWQIVRDAVLEKCDAKDGIKDNIIDNPLACDFKPEVDLERFMCRGDANADNCITRRQLQTIKDIYRGPYDSKGTQIIKGLSVGGEFAWTRNVLPHKGNNMFPTHLGYEVDHVNYLFYEHSPGAPMPVANDLSQVPDKKATPPEFAWWEFNIDDVTAGKGKFMSAITDATDPNLTRFLKRKNGKLLIYHGWGDGDSHPELTYDYYKTMVTATFGGDVNAAREKARLIMVPGMGHCGGGPGCDTWDRLAPLVDWVENGKAPDYVVGEHLTAGKVDNQRRLCAYPQHAVYVGPTGGQNDPANWVEKNFACR
jgi:feruloyl esterase